MSDFDIIQPDADDAIRLSCEAARIILESGGETYRSEDVMGAVATSLGALDPESFATPTGFIGSCDDQFGRSHAIVKRIRKHEMNLEKITRTNELARNAVAGKIDIDGIEKELLSIDALPPFHWPIPSLGAAAATGCFCMFFGGVWNDGIAAAIIGFLLGHLTSWLGSLHVSNFFCNIVGGAFAAAIAVLSTYFKLTVNTDPIIIGSIMLLVPGVTIVNAIRDMIAGDLVAGIARLADAFISAAGISIGVGVSLQVVKIFIGFVS